MKCDQGPSTVMENQLGISTTVKQESPSNILLSSFQGKFAFGLNGASLAFLSPKTETRKLQKPKETPRVEGTRH